MKCPGMALLIPVLFSLIQKDDIREIRRLYTAAPVWKADARKLEELMERVDENAAPVMYCYKGANEMIQAKHSINPLVKLDKFARGKNWITSAISRDTADIEMRFIRFSIQQNLPSFLGYRDDITRDKNFMLSRLKYCHDKELKKMIVNYLTTTGALAPAEKKGLDN